MKTPAWRRYLRFWGPDIEDDVDEEFQFHFEMRVQECMARGMTAEDARRAVIERLGDVDAAKAECIAVGKVRERQARQADIFDALRADVRFALRSLGRTPGWTAVALLTIALGVGATTTVFSIADALLVRSLPYPHASRVFLARSQFVADGQTIPLSIPLSAVSELRARASTIEQVVAFSYTGEIVLGEGSDAVDVQAASIDGEFLTFAGVRPLIGRGFTAEETIRGGPRTVLLTEQFWRREYGASPTVLGKVVRIDDEPHTIVGVVPASLSIPDFRSRRAELIVPASSGRGSLLVRLQPGVSRAAATAEIHGIVEAVDAPLRAGAPMAMPMNVRLTRPQDWLAIRQPVVMITGAVALLLLVACTNVAHLLLARGATRQRELAVRHAIGAGRSRLVRQLVTESAVLAVLGGVLAMIVGWVGLRIIEVIRPPRLVALTHVTPDRDVVTISAVLAVGCGLAIGLFAALRMAHRQLATSLRVGSSGVPRAGVRVRASLVVGEVALSTTLLVGALLLIHAVFALQGSHLGFDARGLYTVTFPLPEDASPAERVAFAVVVRERAAVVPGVSGLTLGSSAPGERGARMLGPFESEDRPAAPEETWKSVALYAVTPDYFATIRLPLIAGRTFDSGSGTRQEVIVSSTLADWLWPDGSQVLGRRLRNAARARAGMDEPWQTVVGVVPDVVSSLVEGTGPGLYLPAEAAPTGGRFRNVTIIVRIDGPNAAERLRQFANSIRPNDPAVEITSVREEIDATLAEPRFTMRVLLAFASLGVVLAAIGLFGVTSYGVGQRTREIGVRMALGATRSAVARLVVGNGIRLALLGIGVGLVGAVVATRLIQSLLYGVAPLDPFAFGLGALLLLVISVVACLVPMLRATGIDPAVAVRSD